ncbi:UDP-N-acetylmuramoyl-tripeptide--D-alanyl-D-alanine ligase [Anaerosacchariphilus polymeriproducens]|uniref:UDP-N-acetylmuramoyl-tripeptide--D-alanyl-D-alanine ligase n=1 Tax=Anaerosacchariphilus polymeriproducens TaxID=1812858 RepID=A0A371AVA3_9FIRM|nr:UDP-N-acetylmuramoyl-tripeptide--D-alanyl-D-alanine ligase [Anaerosacchariphilus polymeriproducens]RDU23471.1 UDP-N-acetylmuramoyl-tripeptide--D-alanyl-D-alanine ligase [Anaerosacchariphilus polymeriproducens]
MKNMTLASITAACSGIFFGNEQQQKLGIDGVVIDSRKVKENFLFIPIKGERVDGHDFIPEVMKNGAACTLSEKVLEDVDFPYIFVDSCEQALKDIAEFYRKNLDILVVGITGSVGKTSTKEIIASVLEQEFNVLKTQGNFNNEIGLPLTIFNIQKEHEVAVVEMGISDFGEMHRLAKVARPDICVITNIGFSHLENLKSREGILKAKTEIFDFLTSDGAIVLNGDDDMLETVKEVNGITPTFFGVANTTGNYADEIESLGLKGSKGTFHIGLDTYKVHIPLPGHHMLYNSLAAASVGKILGLTKEQIQKGIETLASVGGRNHMIEVNDYTIIDDCYNANPVSMKASIDVLTHALGRKIAVVGDMFELGEKEKELHYQVGEYIGEKVIDFVFASGELSKELIRGVQDTGNTCILKHFEKQDNLIEELKKNLQPGDTVLVKASHGMHYENVIKELME